MAILKQETDALGIKEYKLAFLYSEWYELVDARQLTTWEEYRVTPRLAGKRASLNNADKSFGHCLSVSTKI